MGRRAAIWNDAIAVKRSRTDEEVKLNINLPED
jgi:hypothetical protein